jgi:hypothetical protein
MAKHERKLLLTAVVLLSALAMYAQTAPAIMGHWRDEKEPHRQMEFFLDANGLYHAKTINSKDKDMINGQVLLKNLKYDEYTRAFKGLMSPPDANLELDATVIMINNNRLKISAKKWMMSKTIYLIRIK